MAGSSSISTVDQIGGVLGEIGVGREHRCDRLADIAHALLRQDGLAVRRQPFELGQAEIDRRNVGDVVEGPHRHDARQRRAALVSIDTMRPCA